MEVTNRKALWLVLSRGSAAEVLNSGHYIKAYSVLRLTFLYEQTVTAVIFFLAD